MNNDENNEIKIDFGERLKLVAWIRFDGVTAYNTTYAGGKELKIITVNDNPYKCAISKTRPDGI